MAIGGANLDVNGIVGQLMSLEQRPIVALNKKEADYQAKISAYGNISGALSGFQTAVQDLSGLEKFQSLKASSTDSSALTASASAKAATGTYSLTVSSLAQAQKLSVAGQINDTASIGSGLPSKLTFDFGSIAGGTFDAASGKYTGATFATNGQGAKTITIDSSNNTLQGIRDAINGAKMGVTASVINNGSGTPFSLTLSPTSMGMNNSLKISVEGDEAISALLAHDPAATQNLSQTITAQSAVFAVDGVSVSKDNNTIADVIPGVTLNLLKTTDKPVSLNVARDNSGVTSSIQGFVKAYNDMNKTLQELSSFNPATKQGAILQGDSTVRLLQSQIKAILNTPIGNNGSELTTLSQIGITIQKDGTMTLDTTKLDAAVSKNPTDVASLFSTVGKSSDPLVSYSTAGSSTKAGTFPLNISKLATQGSLGGCEEVETLIIEAGENDGLDVKVNGVGASIVLAQGTYTEDSLAAEIQSKINGASALSGAGISVSVKHDQYGYIITSNTFGSKSTVEVAGSGALNLFGKKPVVTPGTDVEGTVNGAPAKGTGQTLTTEGGAALGLKVLVSGGALGERGKVNYSEGYAVTLNNLITSILSKSGQLEGRKTGINSSIKDIENRRATIEQRMPLQEARFRKQYSNLETTLSNMSKTSSYLNQQLANLPRPY